MMMSIQAGHQQRLLNKNETYGMPKANNSWDFKEPHKKIGLYEKFKMRITSKTGLTKWLNNAKTERKCTVTRWKKSKRANN